MKKPSDPKAKQTTHAIHAMPYVIVRTYSAGAFAGLLFARTNFRNADRPFGIRQQDRFQHVYCCGQSGTGKPIVVTEIDIENILRTKASIYAACALMLSQVGLRFDRRRSLRNPDDFFRRR